MIQYLLNFITLMFVDELFNTFLCVILNGHYKILIACYLTKLNNQQPCSFHAQGLLLQ